MILNNFVLISKDHFVNITLTFSIANLLINFINIFVFNYNLTKKEKVLPINLYSQIIKSIIIICTILTTVSILMNMSVPTLFASIGAATALITFAFKDSITSLLNSLQVVLQDIIRVGDWITIPNIGVDGYIKNITMNIVVVRNFDGTCTTVPTSFFLTNLVTNWRYMFESGGRRIKRSINIDMNSINFITPQELDSYRKFKYLREKFNDYLESSEKNDKISNITIFRYYIERYLHSHPKIHKENFTFLVRELNPTTRGLAIELYIFSKDTSWVDYEKIQANIFDHLISILPEFGLKVYQLYDK